MYPRALEDDVEGITDSERLVYDRIRDGLDDQWEAYFSVSWIDRDPANGSDDGEIDFVLCHPDHGIVCLEVKGKGIECRNGSWFRVHKGESQPIKDPFKQALDHRYDLERQIAGVSGWKDKKPRVVHALAFPFITIHQLALAPDAPREILLDRHELKNLPAALDRVLDYHLGARPKDPPPGDKGASMLRELLARDVLIEVPLGAELMDDYEGLVRLTAEQSRLLKRMARNPRMVVTGCAGSGKTTLAVEQARRMAEAGQEVLFVCFNRALRDDLRSRHTPGVTFQTFHGLCFALASRAKISLPDHGDDVPQEFFRETLPAAMIDAIETLGPQYDALIVDEAQDLHSDWLAALLMVLRDEHSAPVWLFMDDNQRVYDVKLDIPEGFVKYDLTVNCRNTQAIHREVLKKYKGDVVPETLGPEGRDVELIHSDDQRTTVAQVLERLCGKEEVMPQDVVVLSSHGENNSAVFRDLPSSRYRLVRERPTTGGGVYFSSIRGFKGLESPVVVLCELEDLDNATIDQQLYVALSRARGHAVVVAPPAAES